jgi:alkaline phosphatase
VDIKIRIHNLWMALVVLLLACHCEGTPPKLTEKPAIKANQPFNVILLIGDGMGLSQLSSSFYFSDELPNFARFKTIGLSNVIAANSKITDSAAGATSFASGIKTFNGAIGVDMDKQPVENIVELLSKENYQTGLIATSSITHATPASFYAHVASRDWEEQIAEQMATSPIDFFAGGGLKFFQNRKDGKNILDLLKTNGFEIYTDSMEKEIDGNKKHAFILGEEDMPKMIEGRGDFLVKSTQKALTYFDKSNSPFFLMVEGSQIDWAGHDNVTDYLITELLDFDQMVGSVLDYAEKEGNTLVIVTADHETGGFTLSGKVIGQNSKGEDEHDYNDIVPTFSTTGHSASLIPVLAFGPGSNHFSGFYQNSDVYHKMLKALDK